MRSARRRLPSLQAALPLHQHSDAGRDPGGVGQRLRAADDRSDRPAGARVLGAGRCRSFDAEERPRRRHPSVGQARGECRLAEGGGDHAERRCAAANDLHGRRVSAGMDEEDQGGVDPPCRNGVKERAAHDAGSPACGAARGVGARPSRKVAGTAVAPFHRPADPSAPSCPRRHCDAARTGLRRNRLRGPPASAECGVAAGIGAHCRREGVRGLDLRIGGRPAGQFRGRGGSGNGSCRGLWKSRTGLRQ